MRDLEINNERDTVNIDIQRVRQKDIYKHIFIKKETQAEV